MSDIKIKFTISSDAGAEEIFQAVLTSRGYQTAKAQAEFLHPPAPTLPLLLKESGLKKSVLTQAKKLLDSHLSAGHDICVFGDYDADGVTATAIMWQAVTAYAKKAGSSSRILPFVPDRVLHGYGLGDKAVAEVISGEAFRTTSLTDFHPRLILTVDTGIVAHQGVKSFKSAGMDVIITDHHLPADATQPALQAGLPDSHLPPADIIIHTTATSGAGVAWIIALALLGNPAFKLLDLATIGVVGDMMPLTGLNRALVAHGLRALSATRRPGLLAMKAVMSVADKNLTTYDISFGIAPRINAAGRIYNPLDALRLLCTSDARLAGDLAMKIEAHNRDRQEYTDRALKLAAGREVNHKIIVLLGDYHEGVIGLVAGKLVEIFHRPAVVMSDNGSVVKGSARSVPGVDITELLRELATPFLGLGGHAQAAGFSLSRASVAAFTSELETRADQTIPDNLLVKRESADALISLRVTSMSLAKLLHTLEPFGLGNPKPKFLLENLAVLEDRALGDGGKHHKLTVEQRGITREVMLFNTSSHHPLKAIKSLICTLDVNVWRDKESLQLIASYVAT